jgi:hypothetical protein
MESIMNRNELNELKSNEIANNFANSIWNFFNDDGNSVYLKQVMFTISCNREIRKNPNDAYYDISGMLNELSRGVNNAIFGRKYRKIVDRIVFLGFYERSDIKLNDHVHFLIRIPKYYSDQRGIKYIINKIYYYTKCLFKNNFSPNTIDIRPVEDSKQVLIKYATKKYNKNTNDNFIVC